VRDVVSVPVCGEPVSDVVSVPVCVGAVDGVSVLVCVGAEGVIRVPF